MKKEEIIKIIGKEHWNDFLKFMKGQTIGINDDGSADYYKEDVYKFIRHEDVTD